MMKYIVMISVLLFSCSRSGPVRLQHPVKAHGNKIVVSGAGVNDNLRDKLRYSVNQINEEVFDNPRCPKLELITQEEGEIKLAQIFVYDSGAVAFGGKFGCDAPWAAVARNGGHGKINLCEKRINPAEWTHALDPEVYVIIHNLSRLLGLPPTTSMGAVASYTANDRHVMTRREDTPMLFRYSDREKTALRGKYCRR